MNVLSDTPVWPTSWVRAALGTAVLACLQVRPLHGYGIAQALQLRGLGRPKGGSLYPLLNALERDEAIEATWEPGDSGPGRRVYALTAAGRRRLEEERTQWGQLTAALAAGPDDPTRGDAP